METRIFMVAILLMVVALAGCESISPDEGAPSGHSHHAGMSM